MLINKYCPKISKDFIINKNIIKSLNIYLTNETHNKVFIITGQIGSGKTTVVDVLLKENKKRKIEINEKLTTNTITEKLNIWKMYNIKNIVYVFEEYENINDTFNIIINQNIDNLKIIFIISEFEIPKTYLSNYEIVETKITNKKNYINFFKTICKQENLDIKINYINSLINKYDLNMREIIINLLDKQEIKNVNDQYNLNKRLNDFLKSEMNPDLFKNESIQLSGYIYQNLYAIKNNEKQLNIMKNIIVSDTFQTVLYTKNINMIDYIYDITCINTLYEFKKYKLNTFEYPKIWSLYSNKCSRIQYKNKLLTKYKSFHLSVYNLLNFRQTFYEFLKNNKIDELNLLCKKIDFVTLSDIISMTKIYDYDDNRTVLNKNKKIIKSIIE